MGLSPRVDERRCGLSERHDYCLRKEMKRKVDTNAVCDCGKDECKGPRCRMKWLNTLRAFVIGEVMLHVMHVSWDQ